MDHETVRGPGASPRDIQRLFVVASHLSLSVCFFFMSCFFMLVWVLGFDFHMFPVSEVVEVILCVVTFVCVTFVSCFVCICGGFGSCSLVCNVVSSFCVCGHTRFFVVVFVSLCFCVSSCSFCTSLHLLCVSS